MTSIKKQNCRTCAKLTELSQQNTYLEENYDEIKKYAANGIELLKNEAYIGFDSKNNLYKFRMVKKYLIVDKIKKFYTIRLHRNKTPGQKNIQNNENLNIKDTWNQVNIKLTVNRKGKAYVYQYPSCKNVNNLKVETEEQNLSSYVLKVHYKEDGITPIIYTIGDEFEIDYSYDISPEYWGNYLERTISYSREITNVYFQKLKNRYHPESYYIRISFSLDSDNNNINNELPKAQYELVEEEKWFKYCFKTEKGTDGLEAEKLKYSKIRIVWDTTKIFKNKDYNTVDPNTLGMASNLPSSD